MIKTQNNAWRDTRSYDRKNLGQTQAESQHFLAALADSPVRRRENRFLVRLVEHQQIEAFGSEGATITRPYTI